MNHNCRGWTPNKRQATSSKEMTDIANAWCMVVWEKEMYLEVVEDSIKKAMNLSAFI